jgi:hypothetical protein
MGKKPQANQRGAVLLLFMVVLIAIASIFVSSLLGKKAAEVTQNKIDHDYKVLRKAKQALLSYAVDYSLPIHTGGFSNMGILPCPDLRTTSSSGAQDSPCGNLHTNSVGFLPWKTLGIDELRDSNGECLWYVVSGDYKTGPKANMLNEDINGLLQVQDENGKLYHGADPGDRPIALILAPGGILQEQSHLPNCQGNSNEENYLESGGSHHHATGVSFNYTDDHDTNMADKIWTYVYGTALSRLENSDFNDKMVWITKDEYWDEIKALKALDTNLPLPGSEIEQLTADLTQCFTDYANDVDNDNFWLPWPAGIDIAEYRNDAETSGTHGYIDQDNPKSLIGRLPQSIVFSDAAETLLTSGSKIKTHANKADIFNGCLTPERKALWRNWKDHFFYAVSNDFEMVDGSKVELSDRCVASGDCLEMWSLPPSNTQVTRKIAAIVFFAGSISNGQSRNSPPVDPDEKHLLSNYLDLDIDEPNYHNNSHDYPLDALYLGDVNAYYNDIGDLVYCIWVNDASKGLEYGKCI